MKRVRYMLSACAAGLLAACGPEVTSITQDRAYSPSEFRLAAGGKSLLTVVQGNPFDVPDTELVDAVLTTMQGPGQVYDTALVRRTRFTATADGDTHPDYRVVVTFGPGDAVDAADLCRGTAAPSQVRDGDGVRARMVFCRDAAVLSASRGAIGHALSPDDAQFRHMIALMTRHLFPHREFRDGDGGNRDRRRL